MSEANNLSDERVLGVGDWLIEVNGSLDSDMTLLKYPL